MNAKNDPEYSINLRLEQLRNSPDLSQDEILALVDQIVGEANTLANEAKEQEDFKKEAELYSKLADIWRQVAKFLPAEWQGFIHSSARYWETTSMDTSEHTDVEKEYRTTSVKTSPTSPKIHTKAFVPQNVFKQSRSSSLRFRLLAKKFKEEGLEEKRPDQITKGDTREFSLRNDLESDQKDPGEFRSDKTDKD